MRSKINTLRMWLAQLVAPPGADVHDDTFSPRDRDILEAVCLRKLRRGENDDTTWMDVTELLHDAFRADLVERWPDGEWKLTGRGERELAALWGPGRVPPWSTGGLGSCAEHGLYQAGPGDLSDCPGCAVETAALATLLNLTTEPAPRWRGKRPDEPAR